MPHKLKRAGEEPTISASDWNSFLKTAEQVLGGKTGYQSRSNINPKDCHDIIAYNNLGSDIGQFSIVGLDTLNATPSIDLEEFKQQRHIWEVVLPVFPTHLGKWGIAQVAIPDGECGVIRVAGVSICLVSGTEPDGAYLWFAEMEDSNASNLVLCHRGTAQVLFRDTGSDWSIVRIGNGYRPTTINAILQDGNDFEQETAADPHDASDIEGVDLVWQGPTNVDVYNPLGIKLWQYCRVVCHYNVTAERWEIFGATSNRVVHGIKVIEDECLFNKLDGEDGWHEWNEGSKAEWVTDVYLKDCELLYDTLCEKEIPITELDFVKSLIYSEGSCSLQVIYNCTDLQDNFGIDLDFVTEVRVGTDKCGLVVTKCGGIETTSELAFVTSVKIDNNVLYYEICNQAIFIANLGPCEEDVPPTCGTADWVVLLDIATNDMYWSVDVDACTGACEPVEPAAVPTAIGQTATTNCEIP